jgi:hypothetical protein
MDAPGACRFGEKLHWTEEAVNMPVRIGSDLEIEETDYSQPAKFGWKEFYDFRNHVVRVLSRFGSVGPAGEADLSGEDDDGPRFRGGVDSPDFFVVEDMWNEHDQLSIVECDVKLVNAELLHSIVIMASSFPGWRVVMNVGDSGLRVYGDRVLVGGRRFWDCTTIEELGARCKMPVEFESPPPSVETMYPLWVDVICGQFISASSYATLPSREWREAVRVLEHMGSRKGVPLKPEAYDRIRCDLHPLTRAEFAGRLFSAASSVPTERLKAARRSLLREAADGLRLGSLDNRRRFAALVMEGQRAAANALDALDVMLWWPYIIDYTKQAPDVLRPIMEAELRKLLSDGNQWIQLSAAFGLARLRVGDIARIVDQVLGSNPSWLGNDSLTEWLLRVRTGSVSYPSGLQLD